MKLPVLLTFLFLSLFSFAQKEQDHIVVFEGYILSEDSVPVENAYLINYRSLKIISTDHTGYFRTYVLEGDSLMINHLSLAPKVIHENENRAKENIYTVPYRLYMIEPVTTNDHKLEMKHFEKNMKILYSQLSKLGLRNTSRISTKVNSYDFDAVNPGLSLNLSNLARTFKKK